MLIRMLSPFVLPEWREVFEEGGASILLTHPRQWMSLVTSSIEPGSVVWVNFDTAETFDVDRMVALRGIGGVLFARGGGQGRLAVLSSEEDYPTFVRLEGPGRQCMVHATSEHAQMQAMYDFALGRVSYDAPHHDLSHEAVLRNVAMGM